MKKLIESAVIFNVSILNKPENGFPEEILSNALFLSSEFSDLVDEDMIEVFQPDLSHDLNESEETKYILGFYISNNALLEEINANHETVVKHYKELVLAEQENLNFKLHSVVLENKYTITEKFEF